MRDRVAYYESIACCSVHVDLSPTRQSPTFPLSSKLLKVGESLRGFQVGGSGGHLTQLAELLQEEIYRNHYREGVRVYAWSRSPKGESLCVPRGSVYVWKFQVFPRLRSRFESSPNVAG